jgi:dipeptidyl aminopeptidase/acylaminoacyl peptidase
MRALLLLSLLAGAGAGTGPGPGPGPAASPGLTVDDMLAMQRISDPEVSPDGRSVAFTVRDTDLEANRGRTDIWLAAVDSGAVRRLTTHPDNDSAPRFSPDGRSIYFLSSRGGSSQVWRLPVDGGEASPVTHLPVDVDGFLIFPDGKRLLLALDVYPDLDKLSATRARDEEREKSKVKARAYETLLFRHWDSWEDGKRSHLFVWSPEHDDQPIDLLRGMDADTPSKPFGDMGEVAISPDGKRIAFTAKEEPSAAWSTNEDLFLVSADGKDKPARITAANKGWDGVPAFSPDGKLIAYLSMARPTFEADRRRIALYDVAAKTTRVLTEAWDRSPETLVWSADGQRLYTSADHLGNRALFSVDAKTGEARALVDKGSNESPLPIAGDRLVFLRDTLTSPAELFTVKLDGSGMAPLTELNRERTKKIAWGAYEPFTFTGAHGDTVHGYVMKPANHHGEKVPGVLIIHGGPQGSMGDHFHYRWNPEAFAGHGFGVVFIDFHGSTGYGQAFTDAIRDDWGGAPFEDNMRGLDAALEKYPWLDPNRMAAAGASYGGYMINWVNGKTDRFKALVCHDGNLDERFAYFDTEELWFPEWEHRGTPWDAPEGYARHNPIDLVKNWKTPTLVIHGALDFRLPDTQGMATFTALQRRGIPSRFLSFPDENHWVLKPQNSKRWHEEVFAWLDRWTKKR